MGSVTLPPAGDVYVDTNAVIYMVEAPGLLPLAGPRLARRAGRLRVVTSHVTLMETLVGPLKKAAAAMVAAYESLYASPDLLFLPVDEAVLREAARLRATIPGIRTPDALHGATALLHAAALFLTNDAKFRSVPGLPVTVLADLLGP